MPTLIESPARIEAAGNKPKIIEEYVGQASTRNEGLSIAYMRSPEGWAESGQTPEFEEVSLVVKGMLRVEYSGGALEVRPGQAVVAHPNEWVRYSTPEPGGAEYVAICVPAFTPYTVHRDDE